MSDNFKYYSIYRYWHTLFNELECLKHHLSVFCYRHPKIKNDEKMLEILEEVQILSLQLRLLNPNNHHHDLITELRVEVRSVLRSIDVKGQFLRVNYGSYSSDPLLPHSITTCTCLALYS